MMRYAWALVAVVTAFGQERPAYEAASVKPNVSGSRNGSSHGSKGQIVFENVPLKRLVERAYDLKPMQVTGPPWMEDVRFDIAAKYPPDTDPKQRSAMLRTLLEDRFHLMAHRETKYMAGYWLVVAKGGLKLKPVPKAEQNFSTNGNGKTLKLTATSMSMKQLADTLTDLGEYVVDRTDVEGYFDIQMEWANPNAPQDADPAPSLFTALQEKLGLKLQPQKVPVEIVVVDRIERTPADN